MRMSPRQSILKTFYPALLWWNNLTGRKSLVLSNHHHIKPKRSIYDFSIELNNGAQAPISEWKGKKILLVNTASDCGYTHQYDQLQELYKMQPDNLIVIGFPANDFKQQEKGNDEDIANFCKINYGVSFPLAKKSTVINGPEQNTIFHWLCHPDENGWCEQEPSWNFSKYLVDENGVLTHYFDPAVTPLSREILDAVKK
jgi:glutathione peroxidase